MSDAILNNSIKRIRTTVNSLKIESARKVELKNRLEALISERNKRNKAKRKT